MKHWSSLRAAFVYHTKEGFVCGWMTCNNCGGQTPCIHPPECDSTKLQCSDCSKQDSTFVSWGGGAIPADLQ